MMSNVVQNLIDLGQIKTKKFKQNNTKFNIRDVVQDVINIQKYEAAMKGLRISV